MMKSSRVQCIKLALNHCDATRYVVDMKIIVSPEKCSCWTWWKKYSGETIIFISTNLFRIDQTSGSHGIQRTCNQILNMTTLITTTLLCPKHYAALKWGTMYKHLVSPCHFYIVKPKCIKMPYNLIMCILTTCDLFYYKSQIAEYRGK